MASDSSSTLALDPHFTQFIQRMVDAGRYGDASDVLHAALRLLEDQEKLRELKLAELRAALQEGEDSGDGGTAEEALAELDELIESMPD